MVAVHVWVVDGVCVKVQGVELIMCKLDNAAEEGCTVEVMLYLERTTEITYVQVDSGCVGVVGEVDRFWVVPWVPQAGL